MKVCVYSGPPRFFNQLGTILIKTTDSLDYREIDINLTQCHIGAATAPPRLQQWRVRCACHPVAHPFTGMSRLHAAGWDHAVALLDGQDAGKYDGWRRA